MTEKCQRDRLGYVTFVGCADDQARTGQSGRSGARCWVELGREAFTSLACTVLALTCAVGSIFCKVLS